MFAFQISKEYRNKNIKKNFKEDLESQEILLDSLAKKKEEELGITEKKFEIPVSKKVLQLFFFLVLILFSCLFLKTFQLQIIEGKKYSLLAVKNKFKIYQIRAERGVIYDRNYKQLVWNQSFSDLILNVKDLPEDENSQSKILTEVSKILKKNQEELKKEIQESKEPQLIIAKNLDESSLILFETKINNDELPGFEIKQNFFRKYETNPNLSHLIGYIGKISEEELKNNPQYSSADWVGRSGLEKSYESLFKRNAGQVLLEKNALGNIVKEEIISRPEPGKSLVLYLDSELQKKIKEELKKVFEKYKIEAGAAVAFDPKTGGILAMVSLPDFDNNLFQRDLDPLLFQELLENSQKPFLNRVISGLYPSASIIKPLLASAVLEEKIIDPEKEIYDPGFLAIRNKYAPGIIYYNDWKPHGLVNLRKAIAESCNVYFYIMGGGYKDQEGLGPERIKKYLELFGWGKKTQIDLPEEKSGFIPFPEWKKTTKKEKWWIGDTYNISVGQGDLLITPLQVVAGFGAIANGKLMKPEVVQKIVDDQKNILKEIKPEIIRENFIKPENLQIVREGMRQAITSPSGSSHLLDSLPVSAAAKTGTAQIPIKNHYHNWVTVFAPYEDPQIVLTIILENVKTFQLPPLTVAKEVLNWYFKKSD